RPALLRPRWRLGTHADRVRRPGTQFRFSDRKGVLMRTTRWWTLLVGVVLFATPAWCKSGQPASVDSTTWVAHDGQPIKHPKEHEKPIYAHEFHEAFTAPWGHAFDIPDKILMATGQGYKHHAANVNRYDEVSNSTWFTNRNHVKA